jgi:hypothetical protein
VVPPNDVTINFSPKKVFLNKKFSTPVIHAYKVFLKSYAYIFSTFLALDEQVFANTPSCI